MKVLTCDEEDDTVLRHLNNWLKINLKGGDFIMSKEVWKDLKYLTNSGEWIDFGGVYQVSNLGNIRSYRAKNGSKCSGRLSEVPRILKHSISSNGYHRVGLVKEEGTKNRFFLVHRIVASTFIDIPEHLLFTRKIQVNHKNEDKDDNRLKNLEWCTPLENTNHGSRTERAIAKRTETMSSMEWKKQNSNRKRSRHESVVGVHVLTGDVVELNSMSCADAFLNITFASRSVSACVRGRQKTAYGYRWFYRDDYFKTK